MFILNGKRFNPESLRGKRAPDGSLRSDYPTVQDLLDLGVTEIPEPSPPEDYSEETYFRNEIDTAPFVVYTKKPADQIASARWERLKQIRDELTENGGCLVQGKWFHTDVRSKQQQIALVMMGAGIPANLQWKTMDGSFIAMTQALAAELFAAQAAREQAIFATAEAKRVDDSPLYEGWPERYVDPEKML